MEAKLDIWIVLFIAAAAQGVFLSGMLALKPPKKEKKKTARYLLVALISTFTITIAYYTTFWTGIAPRLHPAFGIILRFTFLFGPLAYFYVFNIIKGKLPRLTWLHFIPFVLVNLFYFCIPHLFPHFSGYFWLNLLTVVHILAYGVYSLWYAVNLKANSWVLNISISFIGYCLCLLTYYVLLWTGVLKTQHDYMVSMGMTIFIYFIGYHGFKSPLPEVNSNGEKYEKSSLTNEVLNQIMEKIDQLMLQEKLFTNGDLKLAELAAQLELTPHAISQSINVVKNKKFTDYLNELRVEEAISLMNQREYFDAKLLAVAIDSGFNNKTSFLNAFKKQTGLSPSEFRKSIYSKAS